MSKLKIPYTLNPSVREGFRLYFNASMTTEAKELFAKRARMYQALPLWKATHFTASEVYVILVALDAVYQKGVSVGWVERGYEDAKLGYYG